MTSEIIPFEIVYCSSHDQQHPVTNLLGAPSSPEKPPTSAGWQSAKGGRVPQTIVIRFSGNAVIRQLRVLSHESKIASKVELRVYKLRPTDTEEPPSFRNIRFSKLGSVEFNSNERSGHKSKERKTIHLKAEAYFLKLLFDAPHVNNLNTDNQVGVYSIECIGQMVQPFEAHADAAITHASTLGGSESALHMSPMVRAPSEKPAGNNNNSLDAASKPPMTKSPRREASAVTFPAPSEPVGAEVVASTIGNSLEGFTSSATSSFRSVRIIEFEEFFLRRSEELLSLKEQAIAVDDLTTATKCRDMLQKLNARSKAIYRLEQDKVQCIIEEDFEGAKRVKEGMDTLVEKTYRESHMPEPQEPPVVSLSDVGNLNGSPRADRIKESAAVLDVPLPGGTPSTEEAVLSRDDLDGPERVLVDAILSATGEDETGTVTVIQTGTDVRPLISTIGAFACACLFSRRFKLREATLSVLSRDVGICIGAPPAVIESVLRFLDNASYGLQDPIPNVFFAACAFVQMVLSDTFHCINTVIPPLTQLLPRLLTRAGDTLPRVRDEAMLTLTLYINTAAVHPTTLINAVLADPVDRDKRKLPSGNLRAQLARLNLLSLVIESPRFNMESSAEHLLTKILIPGVNHQSFEVRDMATGVLTTMITRKMLTVKEKDLMRINNSGIKELILAHQGSDKQI